MEDQALQKSKAWIFEPFIDPVVENIGDDLELLQFIIAGTEEFERHQQLVAASKSALEFCRQALDFSSNNCISTTFTDRGMQVEKRGESSSNAISLQSWYHTIQSCIHELKGLQELLAAPDPGILEKYLDEGLQGRPPSKYPGSEFGRDAHFSLFFEALEAYCKRLQQERSKITFDSENIKKWLQEEEQKIHTWLENLNESLNQGLKQHKVELEAKIKKISLFTP